MEQRSPTVRKILSSQRHVSGWTRFFYNLFGFALVAALTVLWQMQLYAGGWEELVSARFTEWSLLVERDGIWLRMSAEGMAPQALNMTAFFRMVLAGFFAFLLLQGLVQVIANAVWRGQVKRHVQRLTQIAEEARRLSSRKPQVDHLQSAIDHISPTEPDHLHIGDPDLQGVETAINDLLDRMREANAQQARFVSDASHELRTPIAVLKGYADLLERWGKDDPKVRDEAIAAIQAETGRMNHLVEQLLFLARGDSGRAQFRPAELNLQELLQETWEESRMIDPNHAWVLDAPAVMPYTGDRDMLKQALRILCDNAAKYTPAGQEISLRGFVREDGALCMSVRDQGIGISAEDAPRVFDRFFRSDPARSRQSGGTGLGLSIADWIVTRHGGWLELYSWENIGSRFTMVLPEPANQEE